MEPGIEGVGRAVSARLAVVARLGAFPARLAAFARQVEAAEAAGSGTPAGEWTPRDVVAHLVAVEGVVWQARLAMLSASPDEPAWTWTEPGPIEDPAASTLEGALGLFSAGRGLTLARLEALDDAGWARTGVHATFGRLDVAGLMRVAADHDDEHLAALEVRAGG